MILVLARKMQHKVAFPSFMLEKERPQTEPRKAERGFGSPQHTGQVGRRLEPSRTRIIWSPIQRPAGWAAKPTLKSSWRLVKTGRRAARHGWAFQALACFLFLVLCVFFPFLFVSWFHGAFISLPGAPTGACVNTTATGRKRQPWMA